MQHIKKIDANLSKTPINIKPKRAVGRPQTALFPREGRAQLDGKHELPPSYAIMHSSYKFYHGVLTDPVTSKKIF